MYINELQLKHIKFLNSLTGKQKALLIKLHINSVYDLLHYFPYRYEDRTHIQSIRYSLLNNCPVTTVITVIEHQFIYYNYRNHPKIVIEDGETRAFLIGFNRHYLFNKLKIGKKYWLTAQFVYKYNEVQSSNFDFEEYSENKPSSDFGVIIPIYRLTEGLNAKQMRKIMRKNLEIFLDQIDDEIPDYLIKQHNLMNKRTAFYQIHFPDDLNQLRMAKLRLAFEEFLAIQLAVNIKRMNISAVAKSYQYTDQRLLNEYIRNLPFELTSAQKRALKEIISDLSNSRPMHRLLQGDVGSGKTVIAVCAAVFVASNGYQVALMVPTEVLAIQHYEKIFRMVKKLGLETVLLTGSITGSQREESYRRIRSGEANLIIGTHALIQESLVYHNLSLIIIDEQHKFGVEQRIALSKKTVNPDILVMTATPIPRTLTLTLYGDLDVSVIDQIPSGRKPIVTKWVHRKKYNSMLNFINNQLNNGQQAYFIYPLIEESNHLQIKAATDMFNKLQKVFKNYQIGLIHGKMQTQEKYEIMERFHRGKLQILVSTTVIEVGIDVPNATIMVIENCERFGLSQLHQLRGRVGRGSLQSYCFLVSGDETNENTLQRIKAMVKTNNGFEIAEMDLQLRGPGEILGSRQSGMPELRIADYLRDYKLLDVARKDALSILKHNPDLSLEINRPLRDGVLNYLTNDFLYSG